MQRSSLVVAVIAMIAPLCVHAMQWDLATTAAPGNLWYPGVPTTLRFAPFSDMRFDLSDVTDQAPFYVQFQSGNSYMSPLLQPGLVSDYCDGCVQAPPKPSNKIQLIDANNNTIAGASFTFSFAAYNYLTLVISGTRTRGYDFDVVQDQQPRFYQAQYWTGLLPGAFHTETLWTVPQPQIGGRTATVYTEIPHPNGHAMRSYQRYQQLYMNVSVGDSMDGELADDVLYAGQGSVANTPYFILSPFIYANTFMNNEGLLSSGSILQLTGAGLNSATSYVCVFNNTDRNFLAYSAVATPSSSTTLTCVFPDAIAQVSQNGDDVMLINITTVSTTDARDPGWLPITSRAGNEINMRYTYPLPNQPDGGSTGLTGGQIFGIILAVFVGVGVLGYGGFRLYKHYHAGGFGYESQTDRAGDNKPQQIQYNPSSYQSNEDASKPFQAHGDNI